MRESTVLVLSVFGAVGCANAEKSTLTSSDFAVAQPDLGLDSGVDDQGGARDLAAVVDASADGAADASADAAVDARPAACDGGAAFSDGGFAGRVMLAAIGAGPVLYTARFSAAGWSAYVPHGALPLSDVVLTSLGARPFLVARQTDSSLVSATYDDCTGDVTMLAPIPGASCSLRPAVVEGVSVDVVFKGPLADQRSYHSRFDGHAWTAPTTQTLVLSGLAPSAARLAGVLHGVYTGTDFGATSGKVNDAVVSDAVGGGSVAAIAGATSNLGPVAISTADGTLWMVFVGMDTNLYWVATTAGGVFTTVQPVCSPGTCLATSDLSPILARDAAGQLLMVFHGTDRHLYASRITVGATLMLSHFSAPVDAAGGDTSDLAPALATGVGGAAAEMVYVRSADGTARHARLLAAWQAPTNIGNAMLIAAPALVSLP